MTLLNTASKLYLGNAAAQRAYLGVDKVWDEGDVFVWPSALNTGVPAGTVLTVNDIGGVMDDDLEFVEQHFVNTIEYGLGGTMAMRTRYIRCKFSGYGYYQLLCNYGADLYFEDCTFAGANSVERNCMAQGTFLRCDFSGAPIAVIPKEGNSVFRFNYIHDLWIPVPGPGGSHVDAFWKNGPGAILFEDNRIDMPYGNGTGAFFLNCQDNYPATGPFTINHNRCTGSPSFPIFLEGPGLGPVHITNNELQHGDYSYLGLGNGAVATTILGNRDALTYENIDAAMGGPK